MEKFTGKVWVLDDDIDTDIIIPTEYLALKTIDDMKQTRISLNGCLDVPRIVPPCVRIPEKSLDVSIRYLP